MTMTGAPPTEQQGMASASPQGQEIHQDPPEGGVRGDRPRSPTTGVDRGYVATLDDAARSDLFEVAVLVAYVAKRVGLAPADAAKACNRARLGALMSLTEVRRVRLSTLMALADQWQVPRQVMSDIAAAHPAAIAAEMDEK
jgi:hypothetical protein